MGLIGALQFLTRIPIRTSTAPSMSRSVPWFPVVGALVGALVGGTAAALSEVVDPGVAAALGLAVGILVTGAFHEDGLADLADAVAGGATPTRRLEILKDPRHGTYGVVALGCSILVRWAALAALAASGSRDVLVAAIAAHTLGRGLAVAAMGWQPSATTPGLGADWMRDIGPWHGALGLVPGTVATIVAGGRWTVVVLAISAASALAIVVVARRALGGVTGDALGAVEQVAETAVLVSLSAVLA